MATWYHIHVDYQESAVNESLWKPVLFIRVGGDRGIDLT